MAADAFGSRAGSTFVKKIFPTPIKKPRRTAKAAAEVSSVSAPKPEEAGSEVKSNEQAALESGAIDTSTPEGRKLAIRFEKRQKTVERHARAEAAEADFLAKQAAQPGPNPLFALPEKERGTVFAFLRACPYDDAVQHLVRDMGIAEVTQAQMTEFFEEEARDHWATRIERAAIEANALVRLVEQNPASYSSGILAALGQEAFRQISSGEAQPEAMNRIATLFMKARADERSEQLLAMKREKLEADLRGQVEQALDKLAEEVDRHPQAREAFAALQRELRGEGQDEA
jgi:hypothetical protein